ncbi:hypothetical protein ACHAWF_008010 [Thalassiosira exigua]
MASAALPLLPSIRAKKLEVAVAAAISTAGESGNDESDLVGAHEALTEQKNTDESGPLIVTHNIVPTNHSSLSDAQRSEKMAMMHQKEEKVFGGLPPLESSVASNAIHQYISTTSAFLNSFIADANASSDGIDHKLTVLEKQMAILESKIASMPDIDNESSEDGARDEKKLIEE